MNNNQQNSQWANVFIGISNLTIKLYGCVISCIGDTIGTTPDIINTLLNSVGGFASNGAKNPDGSDQKTLVDWSALSRAFPGITATVYNTYDNDAVLQHIANGDRVLVFVSAAPIGGTGEHCIEYIGNGQCKDPWTGTVRPTSDFPTLIGEWVAISGTWQKPIPDAPTVVASAVNAEGLETYGLDPTNEASNQVVFKTWNDVKNGMYIPVAQYNAVKASADDLQKQTDQLNSEHVADTKEIANLNSSLETLTGSNKDYATQTLDAQQLTTTYTGYMDDIANELNLADNNQTDAQLHDEIINEIVQLRANQKTEESEVAPDKTLTTWENGFKNIVDWIIQHGLNDYLKENNLKVVDLDGNPQDDGIGDRVIAYLDDRFHRLDFLESAINNVKAKVEKSKNLLTQFLGLFYKSA